VSSLDYNLKAWLYELEEDCDRGVTPAIEPGKWRQTQSLIRLGANKRPAEKSGKGPFL